MVREDINSKIHIQEGIIFKMLVLHFVKLVYWLVLIKHLQAHKYNNFIIKELILKERKHAVSIVRCLFILVIFFNLSPLAVPYK